MLGQPPCSDGCRCAATLACLSIHVLLLASPYPHYGREPRTSSPAVPQPLANGAGLQQAHGQPGAAEATAALAVRSGEEIWAENADLARQVDLLADEEDKKEGRRKKPEPTLTEKLYVAWGGVRGPHMCMAICLSWACALVQCASRVKATSEPSKLHPGMHV
jgi:hypothetical protein